MKWFKHDTDANRDPKLEKVLMKYGAEGYALYWLCIELIAAPIDKHNISFELEHDAEILAHRLKMDSVIVEEIMRYMVGLRLFEMDHLTQKVTCLKLANRIENSIVKNPEIKKIQQLIDGHPGQSRTTSEKFGQIQTRLDKDIKDKGQKPAVLTTSRFDDFWEVYPKKRKKKPAREIWRSKKLNPLADSLIEDVELRLARDERWRAGYIPDPTTYLNQERWLDEFTNTTEAPRPKPRVPHQPTPEELARDREKAIEDLRKLGGKI